MIMRNGLLKWQVATTEVSVKPVGMETLTKALGRIQYVQLL